MKSRHGITVALASLSAATASIVGGAIVSQQAVADTDSPAKATVTLVTAGAEGDAFSCTFDDVLFPDPEGAVGTGAAEVFPSSVEAPRPGSPAIAVEGHVVGEAVGGAVRTFPGGGAGDGEAPTLAVTAPEGIETALTVEDVREGTAEECAAIRDDLRQPGAAPPPAILGPTAGTSTGGR